jgi:prepilin-type N-terminal cleavage/methylation domain-containing protein
MPRQHNNRAFTLIELLVVISIIALLIAILLPSLAAARHSAQRVKCAVQMKQIGLAIQMYATDSKDYMPYAKYDRNVSNPAVSPSWMNRLVQSRYIAPNPADPTHADYQVDIDLQKCPSRLSLVQTISSNWRFCYNVPYYLYGEAPQSTATAAPPMTRISDLPGASKTLALNESYGGNARYYPFSLTVSGNSWGANAYRGWDVGHRDGSNLVFQDGHLSFLAYHGDVVAQRSAPVGTPPTWCHRSDWDQQIDQIIMSRSDAGI